MERGLIIAIKTLGILLAAAVLFLLFELFVV